MPADKPVDKVVPAEDAEEPEKLVTDSIVVDATESKPADNDDTLAGGGEGWVGGHTGGFPDASFTPPHLPVASSHLPVASSPTETPTKRNTFGQYLKRIRSAVSRASSGNAGSKARKTGQDATANEAAGPRAPSAQSYKTNSRTTTPVNFLRRMSGTKSPESMRWTTPSPDLAAALRNSIYTTSGAEHSGYTPRARTPEEWSYARRSNLATLQEHAREANPMPNYTTSTAATQGFASPNSRTTSPTAFLSSTPRNFSNLFSWPSSSPRHLQAKESKMDIDSHVSLPHVPATPEPYLTPVQRAEKMLKVRESHWHCHRCAFAMGSNDVCFACGHTRCKKCVKKNGSHKLKEDRPAGASDHRKRTEDISKTTQEVDEKTALLPAQPAPFIPSLPRRSVSPTVADIPRLLNRLTSAFRKDNGSTPDRAAAHNSREEQERAQAAAIKDRKLALPRYRIKYTCDKCGSKFDQSTRKCGSCGHKKCQSCGRWPPRKPDELVAGAGAGAVGGDGPVMEKLEDTLAQYTPYAPRQFVDSGAASVVHDRFSSDKRSFSADNGVSAFSVGNAVVAVGGGTPQHPAKAKAKAATMESEDMRDGDAEKDKDTEMIDDAQGQ